MVLSMMVVLRCDGIVESERRECSGESERVLCDGRWWMVGLKIKADRDSGPLKIAAEVIFGCSDNPTK
jgi:hypothetical protein